MIAVSASPIGPVFTLLGLLVTVPGMGNLLTFLSVTFYSGLAVIFAVAIISHLRVTRRAATESQHDEHHRQAA